MSCRPVCGLLSQQQDVEEGVVCSHELHVMLYMRRQFSPYGPPLPCTMAA
jgi:hypothetical protein